MFSNKQNVDKHVSHILARFRDEKERNNKGYHIAKLYLEVKEYELAKRYIAGFLSVKESYAPAHELLGQILEGLNQTEKAIKAYRRSLELDDKQKGVLLKICELYLRSDIDPERAKYWAERAEKVWPHHDTVFKLREKIYTERDSDRNVEDLEHLIASELVKRPNDPQLRAKLLRLFLDTGRANEAYDHAVEAEKKAPYVNSIEWYQCLQDVFQFYQEESGEEINGVFHENMLLAQCQLTTLTLEHGNVADAADALHKFDQTVQSATKVSGGEEWQIIFREMQAQLYFLAGTLLLKRAQKDHLGWLEATEMAAGCFVASYAYEPPHTKASWFVKASDADKRVFERLVGKANVRASQTGHIIRHLCKGDNRKWVSSVKEAQFGEKGRGRLYDTLFTLRHLKGSKSSSYIFQGSALSGLLCVYPTDAQLREYDRGAQLLLANNLHCLTWIALQYYSVRDRTQPSYDFTVFDDLQYSVANLELASPESLSRLDTMIFLFATVRTTALHQQEQERTVPPVAGRPAFLPVLISDQLCTVEQSQWWSTAYQLFKNLAKENLGKLRLVLQRGIEAVRLRKNHGMEISLLVHIARTFEERVEELKAKGQGVDAFSEEMSHLQNRSVQYWKEATDLLERAKDNRCLPSPKQKLFAAYETTLSDNHIDNLLEEGKYFLACDAMMMGEDEAALEVFAKLNLPEASYHHAQILRKMADSVAGHTTLGRDEEVEQQEEALLTRARDALYLTMDRTRDNKNHKLAPVLANELDEIESRLNRLNSNRTSNESARSEGKSGASLGGDADAASPRILPPSSHSTPQQNFKPKLDVSVGESLQRSFHAPPSPERLDAQIRSLSYSQDTLVKQLMERNEELVKQNAAILAELSASRKLIEKLMMQHIRPADPPAPTYPVVMSGAAASPMHHPVLAPHPAAAQSPLGPHATATPPRPVPPVPGVASPFYGSPYRPHPEYDYAAAYSPHAAGYPLYPPGAAPPLHHHFGAYPGAGLAPDASAPPVHAVAGTLPHGVPVTALAGAAGKEPSSAGPVKSSGTHMEDNDDYYYCGEEEEGEEEDDAEEGDLYQIPDSQLMQEWPYGNAGAATSGLPMPGPGFFSSPERPAGAYNAGRYVAPGMINGVSPQLHPPRPGFIGTIGSPASAAQAIPSTVAGSQAAGITTGRSPAQVGSVSSEAAFTGDSLIKLPQPKDTAASNKFTIPLSTNLFSGNASTGAPITTVSGMGATNKDVQPKSPGANDEEDDEGAGGDDSYQGPDFEPIIPLPDEVEVKTGEEEEEVLLEVRCKVYRLREKQWKERGVGDIRILWNRETGQARVVMRRDQVKKVCVNHNILPDMKIDVKSAGELRILAWIALDFSETSTGEMEQLSAKFKTDEIASNFKTKFEEAKSLVTKAQTQAKKKPEGKKSEVKSELFEKFKPKAGSWECEMCLVSNPPEVVTCNACETAKPGTEPQTTIISKYSPAFGAKDSSGKSGFTFGSGTTPIKGPGFVFGQTEAKQDNKTKVPPNQASFTFGKSATTTTASSGFVFGASSTGGFTFGTPASTAAKPTATISPPKFTFSKPVTTPTSTEASDALKLLAARSDSTSTEDKPTFGGFTFDTQPVVLEKKEESKKPEQEEAQQPKDSAKPNPFAGFSFVSPQQQVQKDVPKFAFGASPEKGTATATDEPKKTVTQNLDATVSEAAKAEAADESGHAEDYEPDVDFQPVIPLPDLVEVNTGEEEEAKLFGHKAKLYRHDTESKQWKERGVGEMKILKHSKTGKVRVLMRRDQVLKLCANHYITKEMSLQPLKGSDRAWCWYAKDFSENEIKFEQLAVKFKELDVATKFKVVFEQCQAELGKQAEDKELVAPDKPTAAKPQEAKPSIGEMFKPKAGQWECQACYVPNGAETIKCAACQTPKPGSEAEAAKDEPKKDLFAGGFKFGEGVKTQTTGQVFTFGNVTESKKDGTPTSGGFLFGSPKSTSLSFTSASTPVSATTAESSITPSSGKFNLGSSGFKFGVVEDLSKSSEATKTTFGVSSSGFNFTPSKSPAKYNPKSPQSPEGDFYVNTEDEDSHIYFEPIVQLPEKHDLKTGEENEEPLYCHRAKLFRYDDDQWKERGLGDIKILRHKETKKCRLVMRREQILKICLNHNIDHSLNLQPMPGSKGAAWVWFARDFAEGLPNDEKLAIKFKTAEIANEFKKAFDEAKDGEGKTLDLPPTPVKVRERTDSSSRDSTRERRDSAKERKDSAKERERRQSSSKSDTPDKAKPSSSLESFTFKPATLTPVASSSSSRVSFGTTDSKVSSVFGGAASATTTGKFSFGSSAAVSTGFNFGQNKPASAAANTSGGGDQSANKNPAGSNSLLAQMLMSDEPVRLPEVEVLYEKKPSKEQVSKAKEFQLPSTFYNYEDAPACPGCRGCENDDTFHQDVLFVNEELPSLEKVALAEKYMLPKTFFLYESKPPCPGCLGCRDDIEGTTVQKHIMSSAAVEKKGNENASQQPSAGDPLMFGQKTSNEFSFASIAAKSGKSPGFVETAAKSTAFSFAGSGARVFGAVQPGEEGEEGTDDNVVQSEDIHFEPIVHLEEVEVKTGEEDETSIYSQRSKLFRFTDGQWKERGVGDMKILQHNQTGKFRLLMRRAQIHKLCCNQNITKELELRPMTTSDVTWCWFGTDFADGKPEYEQFALKFKTTELAKEFKDKVAECQKNLAQSVDAESDDAAGAESAESPDTSYSVPGSADTSYGVPGSADTTYSVPGSADHSYTQPSQSGVEASASGQHVAEEAGAEGGEDDDQYETEEEEEPQPLFSKRATLFYEESDQTWKAIGMGDLHVIYDDDLNCNRIRMTTDNGGLICNHVICREYHLQSNEKKKFVEWSANDFSTDEPMRRTFRVQFSSKNSVTEFKTIFAQGVDLAKENDVRESNHYVPTPIFDDK